MRRSRCTHYLPNAPLQDTRKIPRAGNIDALEADLDPRLYGALRKLFEDQGLKLPLIIWSPNVRDLKNPLVARFGETCASLPHSDERILARDFNMNDFAFLADWMLLIDVEQDGTVFRYAHYGNGIANVRGVSMLGQTTAVFGGFISQFFEAVYSAVIKHKKLIYTTHEPPKEIFARNWERLIVPLFDSGGNVVQFAVINVPDNELCSGLEIIPDPVLIADENQIVRYANRPAREMFGHQSYFGSSMDLFTFAGIAIEMPAPPTELVHKGAVHDVVSIVLRGTMVERFLLTISATAQLGHAFYVITLRPSLGQSPTIPPI